jgi:hypothetical protein
VAAGGSACEVCGNDYYRAVRVCARHAGVESVHDRAGG